MSGVFVYFPPPGDASAAPENEDKNVNGIFVLRLGNPPLNILNKATRLRILADLEGAVSNSKVKTIILVGSESAFSVGADIGELNSTVGRDSASKRAAMKAYVDAYKEHNLASIVYALDSCPKPVIALITGQCFGGGLELALGCQYRICTEDATFRFPEALIGIIPGALGTQLLPRLVNFSLCLEMCAGKCETVGAKKALKSGLVDQLLPPLTELDMPKGSNQRLESYLARVVKLVQVQLDRGGPTPYRRSSTLPLVTRSMLDTSQAAFRALKAIPRLDRGGRASRGAVEALLACVENEKDFFKGAKIESEISTHLVVSDEAQALRWAFFAEKNLSPSSPAPVSSSSTGTGANKKESTEVGVVGSGTMGSGIAASVLLAGYPVVLCDLKEEALAKARKAIEGILRSATKRGKISTDQAKAILERNLVTTTEMDGLSKADYVIEAVFEDYGAKKEVMSRLDDVCKPTCILCSNTSSLDVDVLAAATTRPRQVLGMHFFSPAHIMQLVEVVKGEHSSAESVHLLTDLTKKIRKVGVLVKNSPGFVGNRMIFVYVMEAMLLLEDGASVGQVDAVMRRFGMAMGPFEMSDLSGLDVGYSIRKAKGLVAETAASGAAGAGAGAGAGEEGKPERYSAIADILYQSGRLGVKNGKGFYKYATPVRAVRPTSSSARLGPASPPADAPGSRRRGAEDPEVAAIIEKERHRKAVMHAAARSGVSSGLYESTSTLVQAPKAQVDRQVELRLLYCLINEGFKLLGEGCVLSNRPGDIDIVYNYGYGWPAYRGGPMFFAEFVIGLPALLEGLRGYAAQFPTATWFQPAPLLQAMVAGSVSVYRLQKEPGLVAELMKKGTTPTPKSKL
jgi:3-hydroxyacyl-CoA dehydrogenase/enoyl-CoA hydratase/carnithine racemase